ncbi:SDR family NAD(P)-dependent oxidoreductase [Paenibacillus sp. CF384]|uniref:SDR family NAD(P)-dependent oxidoreductase n=1 Tax=Paenibacillus sp. CF384 TaxID=1884382 RepID=UPI000898C18A|nr:3-oxoacyl-ACP reductase family protein [Paenibacillus sp. CF384]SDX06314.1 3-oxoacyl-[acyl-carrier protein] reductase [Paenibacillus sp. CF384]
MQNLFGKVALVTGASSGIGRATAELMASRGAKVAIHYRDNIKGATEVLMAIRESGGDCIAVQADVTQKDQVETMVQEVVSTFGAVDILVNNAGGGVKKSTFMDMTEQLWEETYALNVKSILFCSQAALNHMIPQKSGKIINLSSAAARLGGAGESIHYASAKGAVNTLTVGMSRELIEYGIIVNGIAPGMVDTPFHEKFAPDENRLERLVASVPVQRAASPVEIAEVICFLASDAANYVLGETITVSGGR